jgi:hypothetical protein
MMQNDIFYIYEQFCLHKNLLSQENPKLASKLVYVLNDIEALMFSLSREARVKEESKRIAVPECDPSDPKITAEEHVRSGNQVLNPDYDVGISGMASQQAKQSPKYPPLPYPNHPIPYPRY